MSPLDRNLAALRVRDAELASRVASAGAVGADVRVETSPDGVATIRVGDRLEASAVDPERDGREQAVRFLARAEADSARRLVIFGMGVHTLAHLGDFEGEVLVVEPSLDVFRAVLGCVDLRDALSRFDFAVGDDPALALRHRVFVSREPGLLLAHPAALRRAPEIHDALARRFHPGGPPRRLEIAVVPPFYGGSLPLARACARALSELGHGVRYMDLDPFLGAFQTLRATPGHAGSNALGEGLVRLVGEWLLASFSDDPPDLMLALAQAPVDPTTLDALRRSGITTALWFCEDFRVLPAGRQLAPLYDTIFHLQPDEFQAPLREAGAYAVPLPVGFDPQLHRPVRLDDEERRQYECDFSFIGAGYHNRVQFAPGLVDLGLRIYGTEWPLVHPLVDAMPEPNVRQSAERSNLIFNATRVNLNLHSSPWCDGVNPAGDYLNPRTFELAGARAFQLVDERRYLGDAFEAGREVATFADLGECRKKVAYYLAHPDERSEMAQAAHDRALAAHTIRHRMETVIDALRAGPVPLVARRRSQQSAGEVIANARSEPGLAEVLERLDPQRRLDLDAASEAVARGVGPLSHAEKRLLFMREAFGELRPVDEAGAPQ